MEIWPPWDGFCPGTFGTSSCWLQENWPATSRESMGQRCSALLPLNKSRLKTWISKLVTQRFGRPWLTLTFQIQEALFQAELTQAECDQLPPATTLTKHLKLWKAPLQSFTEIKWRNSQQQSSKETLFQRWGNCDNLSKISNKIHSWTGLLSLGT